jgi:hypothetical protein
MCVIKYVCMYVRMCVYVCIYVYIYMCVYVYMYVCVCVCMYVCMTSDIAQHGGRDGKYWDPKPNHYTVKWLYLGNRSE